MPHAKNLFSLLRAAAEKVPERSLKPLPISGDDVYVIDLDAAKDMPKPKPKPRPEYVYWGNHEGYPIEVLHMAEYNGYKIGDYHSGLPITHIGIIRWECPNEGKIVAYFDSTKGYGIL